jgi:hypothetical protein
MVNTNVAEAVLVVGAGQAGPAATTVSVDSSH